MNETGWFADLDEEQAPVSKFRWRPFLQLRGHVVRLDVWFASEADCNTFIRTEIIGKEILSG